MFKPFERERGRLSSYPAIRVRGTGEVWGRSTRTYWDAPSAPKVVRTPNGTQDDAEHPLHARRNDRVSAKEHLGSSPGEPVEAPKWR